METNPKASSIQIQSICPKPLLQFLVHPEGPSTQYSRTLVPKTILLMVFGTKGLKYRVLGPSGIETIYIYNIDIYIYIYIYRYIYISLSLSLSTPCFGTLDPYGKQPEQAPNFRTVNYASLENPRVFLAPPMYLY